MRVKNTALWFALQASTCLAPVLPGLAGELPTGPSVVHGSVGIASPTATTMTMRQSSATAIVNWQGFSVGAGASVNIQQPSASSALLNRVTGAATSSIAGSISANGQVYLVNPNGIVITPTGTVRAGGGFVASTLGISDEDFKAGRKAFAGTGASAAVINQGTIEVGRGGYAALLGGSVENAGTISVPLGRVGLGAGERATLDMSGDGFLEVAVPSGSAGEKALIQHSGRIRANGGRVEMRAATAREVARQAINLTGVVEARTVAGRSGAIVLGGGAGGSIAVSGRLTASATRPARRAEPSRTASAKAGKGGEITITGDRIKLTGATLDTSGRHGGGSVRIGGDLQGKGSLPHARTTMVDSGTQIRADATESGNGGTVILWSDEFTGFGGLIQARGGANGGDGGFAEVSSKGVLGYNGQTILTAARGKFGTLLLDPYDIYIETGPTTSGWTFTGTPDRTFTPPVSPPSPSTSVVNVTDLQIQLANANVTIQTAGAADGNGDITVGAPISWTQPTILRLDASRNIIIGEAISAPQGGLTLSAGGTITTPASYTRSDGTPVTSAQPAGAINVGTFVLEGGAWTQSGSPLPAFSATDFRLDGGSFLRVLGGSGTSSTLPSTDGITPPVRVIDPYLIADIYGLQGVASTSLLASHFALANDIDASGTRLWTGDDSAGFVPIGFTSLPYSGTFDGRGHTIRGLFINIPSSEVGLFGAVTGSVMNVALTGVSITGNSSVGAIAGTNSGLIHSVTASGTVSGNTSVGGLVGQNTAASPTGAPATLGLRDSHSDVSVQATTGAASVGGAVGTNSGELVRISAMGPVTAGVGSSAVGGLVGTNSGSVSETYSTGAISGGVSSTSAGGLVGTNTGTVQASFWDTTTSGMTLGVGSGSSGTSTVTGLSTAQFQDAATFVPLALAQGWDFGFYWAPPGSGFYPQQYRLFPVTSILTSSATRFYGDPNPSFLPSYLSHLLYAFAPEGDTAPTPSVLATTATFTSPVGSYPITSPNVTSAGGVTYRVVTMQPGSFLPPTLAVTPAPLAITASSQSAVYGSPFAFAGTEFSATGLRNGETVGSATLSSAGATARANVGSYQILAGNAAGGTFSPGNYSITYLPGTLSVTPAPLTLTAGNQSAVYGAPFAFAGTEFSATGLRNGETVGSATLSSAGASATANVGSYQILADNAAGGTFSPSNYSITYLPGTLSVTPAPLTLTANNQSAVYGGPFAFAGTEFSATGLRNGETVGSAALSSMGASATANVGDYQILAGNAAGGTFSPGNYSITYLPGTLSVTPAPLVIAANDQLRALGAPFFFTGLEFTATGLRNGETVGSATLSSAGAAASADAGLYPIEVSGAAGGSFNPSNYAIAYVPGVMTVGAGAGGLAQNTQAGVLARQLPTTTINLPNPIDSFDLSGGGSGGGGPTLGTGRPGEQDAARSSLAAIERSSNDLEAKVANCDGQKDLKAYTSCVGDALTQFADALEARAIDLPGPMRGIPAVIRQAARQVRAARTVQQARAAVGAAVAEVRKAIALIRADDPAIGRLQVQQANRIVSALGSVETRLSRATGL